MSQWVSEQYATWREQLSAATSAIGPLRLTESQLLHLLVRKPKHNLLLHLRDFGSSSWPGPVWVSAMLLAVVVGAVLLLVWSATGHYSRRRKVQLPKLHMQRGWDYPALLKEGAQRYPNCPYIISYNGYDYVVFPSSSFDEVKRLNTSQASSIDWFNKILWQGWAFMGTDNRARYHTIATDLSRVLPSHVWTRQDSAKAAFTTVLGPHGTMKDWKNVSLWRTLQKVITIMNTTALLGPDVGVNQWLKATQRLHMALVFGIIGSHLIPHLLRPLISPLIFVPARLVDWHMKLLLRPMVERELDTYEAEKAHIGSGRSSSNGTIPTTSQHNRVGAGTEDQRSVKGKFPLTEWLLNRYQSGDDRLNRLLRDYMVITMEATVSSSTRLYFMLAKLATRPDLVQEL